MVSIKSCFFQVLLIIDPLINILTNNIIIENEVRIESEISRTISVSSLRTNLAEEWIKYRILLENFHVKGNIVREHNIWTQLDDVVDYRFLARSATQG